jgi:hypothetical protein
MVNAEKHAQDDRAFFIWILDNGREELKTVFYSLFPNP